MRGGRPHNCRFFAHLYHKLLPPPPPVCHINPVPQKPIDVCSQLGQYCCYQQYDATPFSWRNILERLRVIIWDKYLWQHISHFWWHSFTSTPCVEIRKYHSVICRLRVDTHRDKWTPFAEALGFVNLGRDNVYAANYTRSTTTFFLNALIVDCINWVPFILPYCLSKPSHWIIQVRFVYTEKKI